MRERPKSPAAAASLLTLAAAGILIWSWHNLQKNRGPAYDASGFSVAEAPPARQDPFPETGAPGKAPDRLDLVLPEPRPAPPPTQRPLARQGAESARRMRRAVDFYYELKRSPRFRDSALLRDWKRDFLSYPDLDYLNSRYQKDRDAVKFLSGAARSPNFKRMLEKYLKRPDTRDFLHAMTQAPEVQSGTGAFTRDKHIASLAESLEKSQP